MKSQAKFILLLVVALVGVTQVYRSETETPVAAAKARLLATLDTTLVLTGATRTQNVLSFCGTTSRTTLISDTDISTAESYFSTLKMYFSVDAIMLIKSVLAFDLASLMTQEQSLIIGLAVYVVPFLIGLVLSLTLWSCLCCCCACPSCCPSKCCQHDENLLYTKCEMLWPVIFLMLVLLLACAAAVPGITRASTLSDSIKTMQCGVSLALDDLLNGNVTSDKSSFFMGASTLNTYLLNFKGNITDIINNFTTNLGTDISQINGNLTTAKTNLGILPTGGTANASYVLSYTNPTTGAGTVASIFPSVLGTANDSTTLTGSLFTLVDTLSSSFAVMNTAVTTLSASSGTIVSGIQTAADSILTYSNLIAGVDTSLTGSFSMIGPYLDYIRYAFLGYYGAVIGLSVLALLGVIVMACFDKTGCRHLMYVSCVIMFIACLVGFLLSFLLSIVIPILYMGCSVINPALDSSASFLNVTSSLNLPSDITSVAAVCLPGGGGAILNQFGSTGADINSKISDVNTMMTNIQSYGTYDTTPLTAAIANVGTTIDDYTFARRNDIIQDTTSLNWFNKIANQSYPAACSGDAVFLADSLVPSTSSLSLSTIPCKSGITVVANASCTDFSATGTCPAGCIDMYNVMDTAGSLGTFTGYFTSRYSAGCAAALNTEFTDVYNNWYTPRKVAGGGIPSVKTRWNAGVATDLANVVADIGTVKPNMVSTFSTLNGSINRLVDPTYGMVAGINCLLIGEDLKTAKNTLCVTLFNSLYFLFMTIGTASFALLFSMCCIVCSGVRHYKQSLKKNGKPVPDGSSLGIGGTMNQGMPMHHMPAKQGYY